MNEKKIYLHIGSHKTGTSAIYQFLSKNKQTLEREHDIFFHEPNPWPLKMKKNKLHFSLQTRGLAKVNSISNQSIIISHENYSWINKTSEWEKIYNSLNAKTNTVKIIWYIRRQDSLAVSQKQEGTKWIDNSLAYGHDLEPLPKVENLNKEAKVYLDYLSKYKTLSSVFGKENIIVRIFEKERLVDNDIVKDFCSILNIKLNKNHFVPGKVNESISALTQIFLHKTRKYFDEYSIEKKYLTRTAVNLKTEDKQKFLPSKDQAKKFYYNFKPNNNELYREIYGKEGELFTEEWSIYPDEIIKKDITFDELNQIYASIINKMGVELELWRKRHKDNKSDEKIIKSIHKLALNFENKNDFASALAVMNIAREIRPNGPFIIKKIKFYEEKVSVKN